MPWSARSAARIAPHSAIPAPAVPSRPGLSAWPEFRRKNLSGGYFYGNIDFGRHAAAAAAAVEGDGYVVVQTDDRIYIGGFD